MMAKAPVGAHANPKFPPNNVKELIEHAKTRDEAQLRLGRRRHDDAPHGRTAQVQRQGGHDPHALHRGGTPAMNDLIAGHLPMSFGTVV